MSYTLRVLPAADRDVEDIAAFILRSSLENAASFYDALETTYSHIVHRPLAWRPIMSLDSSRAEGLRYRPVLRQPNRLVLFRVADPYVGIVRVIHAARDLPAVLIRELSPDPE